ncbi:MAG: hypothetical protein RIM99_01755 [Cyclobacteriaceae bacterium]
MTKNTNMSRAGLVDFYLKKAKEDGFEIDQIRKELESQNISDDEIKIIVKLVDSEIQKSVLKSSSKNKSKELIGIGAVLTILGLVITMGTYFGLIPSGNSFLIVYGPFIAGLSLMLGGWVEARK